MNTIKQTLFIKKCEKTNFPSWFSYLPKTLLIALLFSLSSNVLMANNTTPLKKTLEETTSSSINNVEEDENCSEDGTCWTCTLGSPGTIVGTQIGCSPFNPGMISGAVGTGGADTNGNDGTVIIGGSNGSGSGGGGSGSGATGGSGGTSSYLQYIWLKSTNGCPSSITQAIPGATSLNYNPPTLTQTTYYSRAARRVCTTTTTTGGGSGSGSGSGGGTTTSTSYSPWLFSNCVHITVDNSPDCNPPTQSCQTLAVRKVENTMRECNGSGAPMVFLQKTCSGGAETLWTAGSDLYLYEYSNGTAELTGTILNGANIGIVNILFTGRVSNAAEWTGSCSIPRLKNTWYNYSDISGTVTVNGQIKTVGLRSYGAVVGYGSNTREAGLGFATWTNGTFAPCGEIWANLGPNIQDRIIGRAFDDVNQDGIAAKSAQTNLALNKPSSASSVFSSVSTSDAVDGNTNGVFDNGSVFHSASSPENDTWWEVDLEEVEWIDKVTFWNRTDYCCGDRSKNLFLLVSETPFSTGSLQDLVHRNDLFVYYFDNVAPNPSVMIDVNCYGRYVRIARNSGVINFAELQVMGRNFIEPGVPDITVNLLDCNNGAGNSTLVTTTTTGLDGRYMFDNVCLDNAPNDYIIEFESGNFNFTIANQGNDDFCDSDANINSGQTDCVTLTQNSKGWDVGLVPGTADLSLTKTVNETTVSVGDNVTYNIFVTNEGPSEATNVSVSDQLPDALNYLSHTTVTGDFNPNTGIWTIGNLTDGQTVILSLTAEVLNADNAITNFAQIQTAEPEDPDSTPGNDTDNTPNEDDEDEATVTPNPTIDLSLTKVATPIQVQTGGAAQFDITVRNVSAITASDVTVKDVFPAGLNLISVNPSTGFFNQATGIWTIGTLQGGDSETISFGVIITQTSGSITNFAQIQTANPDDIDSTPGNDTDNTPNEDDEDEATIVIADDGAGTVGDFVFNDLDGDGVQDFGEPGIEGIIVKLQTSAGNTIEETITDENGFYIFTNVTPDDYKVMFNTPAGFAVTVLNQGGNDNFDSDVMANQMTAPFSVDPNENVTNIDAGYIEIDPNQGSIGDFVFQDNDGDGIQDTGETGIPNVTVQLKDCGNNVLQTTITDASGLYSFINIAPACYRIGILLPDDFSVSPQNQQSDDTVDSDISPSTLMSGNIIIIAGENDDSIDAGLVPDNNPGSIGDFVFQDDDGDGIQDTGEVGVPNVPVELRDCANNVIQNTTTSATGFYSFNNLNAGCYRVSILLPSGFSVSPQNQGNDNLDSDINSNTLTTDNINLAQGENNTSIDAGFVPDNNPGSIGDFVFQDDDGDGIQDTGEVGVPNVPVQLRDCANNVIQNTTTSATGFYSFNNLNAGCYRVSILLPGGFSVSPQNQGNDNLDSDINSNTLTTGNINLAQGENNNSIDAGLVPDSSPCDNVTDGGTIGFTATCKSSILVCDQNVPPVMNCVSPSGGSGDLEIIWLRATNNPNCNPPTEPITNIQNDPYWSVITGETGLTLSPSNITEKTCYLRCSRRENCDIYIESNIIMADLDPNCGGDPDCETDIEISVVNGTLVVSGLDGAPISSLQVINSNWQTEYSCFINCNDTEILNLAAGTYYVYAKYYTTNYQLICEKTETITISGGCTDNDNDGYCVDEDCDDNNPNLPATIGTPCNDYNLNTNNDVILADGCSCEGTPIDGGGDPNCDLDIVFTTTGNGITISGLDGAPVSSLQIFNSSWQQEYSCFANCNATETVPLSPGDYHVYAKYYSASYSLICQKYEIVTVSGGCTDNDNDGYCAIDDCDDANPNIPAAPGTSCNDYDSNTDNDIIQPDGCTCAGTPFLGCPDNDNDGYCVIDDCDDANPNIPAAPGTSCNDYDSNTDNDIIQSDGCTCAGTPSGGGDPDCNDISITSGNSSITVSGLDGAPISSLQIFNSSWQQEYSCFANCDATETVSVSAGTYYVYAKYYTTNYSLICQQDQTITVTNGGGGNECSNLTNGGEIGFFTHCAASIDYCPSNGNVELIRNCEYPSGGTGAIEYIWLKSTTTSTPPTSTTNDPNWSIIPDADQASYQPNNITETTYFIRCARRATCVNYVGEANVVTVSVDPNCDNGGGGSTDPNCGDVNIYASNGQIIATGLDGAPVTSVQIFNASWQTEFSCFANCDSPSQSYAVADGTYYVYVKYYSASYQQICEVYETLNVVNGQAALVGNTNIFDFQTQQAEEHTKLVWIHNGGDKIDTYVFEHSTDGENFESILEEASLGTQLPEVYTGYDFNPIAGDNFYRIKMLNMDGSVSYSSIQTIQFTNLIDFTLFPNPANRFVKVNLETLMSQEVDIHIYNNLGMRLKAIHLDEVYSQDYQIDLKDLQDGHYTIWVSSPGKRSSTQTLIINQF